MAALLLLIVGSFLGSCAATNVCAPHSWYFSVLNHYCVVVEGPACRSPACSIYRVCGSNRAASPQLGPALCSPHRIFVTLCTDRPDIPECIRSRRQLAVTSTSRDPCDQPSALRLWSTEVVQRALAGLCSTASESSKSSGEGVSSGPDAIATDVCRLCSNEQCDVPDPLLAYAALCVESPDTESCRPWAELCAQETVMAVPALCPDATTALAVVSGRRSADLAHSMLRANIQHDVRTEVSRNGSFPPPPPADPCVQDSTQPSCKLYEYPETEALVNIHQLCSSMPDMPGCAIARACSSDQPRVAKKYCQPFVLLATLCHDMPGMRGCESYKALCSRPGSVVEQCTKDGPVPRAPTWSQARKAVFGACADHPMEGCAACTAAGCPDPLASLSEICHEMPDMAACGIFWSFCDAAKREDVQEWCAEDDRKYLPSMLMYFHQRTQELLLWKQWRPRTPSQYIFSVLAIVAMGVVATGLKTVKGALVLQWNHQRALSGLQPPRVVSVWLPQSGQTGEILAKAAITGVSLTLDYFNMLIAMTFNVGFFCAVIVGYIVGSLLFSHVLENYAALLHQRRKDAAAQARRLQVPRDMQFNGGVAGGTGLANCNGSVPGVGVAGVAAAVAAGATVGVVVASRGGSYQEEEDEDEEEKLLMAVEVEGECNCVHSA